MAHLHTSSHDNSKGVTIQVRAREEQRALIDKAAEILGRNRSDFLLDIVCREAEAVLLDQRLFFVDEEVCKKFKNALDNPPADNKKLKRLLDQKMPWKK